jgi:hypothetical protein
VSALRPRSAAALVAWTLLTWVGRVPLLWSDEEESTAAKLGSTVPVLVFVVLAVAAVVLRQRHPPPAFRNSPTSQATTSKPHASSWRPTRTGVAGITTVLPTTTELAQNPSASSSSSHSGSGTRASTTFRP